MEDKAKLRRMANQWYMDKRGCSLNPCINSALSCCNSTPKLKPSNWFVTAGYVPCFCSAKHLNFNHPQTPCKFEDLVDDYT